LEQVTRCYIYLSDNYFLSFSCRAPSLTRGRVCRLQCNDSNSVQDILRPLMQRLTRCYISLSDNYLLSFSCRAPSLTRGRVCSLQCNDSNSVQDILRTLMQRLTRCYISLSDSYFLSFSCRKPSLTRGRVCNLQCNDAKFKFKIYCDRRSFGQFVLVPVTHISTFSTQKQTNKLHGLSQRANYTEGPPLLGEVVANFCG
jgi:hypothetical protein